MPLQRRRSKSAGSRDARPRAGINAAPQGIIRGPSALDARVEPRVKSAESLFLGVALASNRRAIEMIEQIFSVGIESSGISLIGASPSEQTVCDTSKLFTRCVTRLEQDHRREGRYSWMMVLSGKADEDGGYDFGANATAGRGRGARLETARPSARGSLPARREILIPRGASGTASNARGFQAIALNPAGRMGMLEKVAARVVFISRPAGILRT